jgi:hypothetical protein
LPQVRGGRGCPPPCGNGTVSAGSCIRGCTASSVNGCADQQREDCSISHCPKTKFVRLDVHNDSIVIAVPDAGRYDVDEIRAELVPWQGRRSHTSRKRQRVSQWAPPGIRSLALRARIEFVRIFVAGVIPRRPDYSRVNAPRSTILPLGLLVASGTTTSRTSSGCPGTWTCNS